MTGTPPLSRTGPDSDNSTIGSSTPIEATAIAVDEEPLLEDNSSQFTFPLDSFEQLEDDELIRNLMSHPTRPLLPGSRTNTPPPPLCVPVLMSPPSRPLPPLQPRPRTNTPPTPDYVKVPGGRKRRPKIGKYKKSDKKKKEEEGVSSVCLRPKLSLIAFSCSLG